MRGGVNVYKSANYAIWRTLSEVCLKVDKINWKEYRNKELHYIDLSSVNRENNKITETQIINSKSAPSRAQQIVKKGDVVFGTTRPTLKRHSFITSKYDEQICSTGFCVLRGDKNHILPKYIFYAITTSEFYNYVEENQVGAGYPSISDKKVKEYVLPVPPLSEQERIVSILDKFDTLVNDTSFGISAEIEARRVQYEYYRDKLLSFEELELVV